LDKPRLKTFLTIYPISDASWGVRGGNGEFWSVKLHDQRAKRVFGALLPFLDGDRSKDSILAEIDDMNLDRALAEQLLRRLEEKGLIEDAVSHGLSDDELLQHREQIALFSAFGSEGGAKHQAKLRASRVVVIGEGTLAEILCRQLVESGVGRVSFAASGSAAGEGADSVASNAHETLELDRRSIVPSNGGDSSVDLVIVAQNGHDPELLEAMDTYSKSHDVPWLLVRSTAQMEGWVGPLFIPRDTASYVSFEARLRVNMGNYDQYVDFDRFVRQPESSAARVGGLRANFEALAGIAVTEAVKHLTGIAIPVLAGKFLTIDLVTLETEVHEVLRLPRVEDESYSRPGVFPWKEQAFDVPQTRRA
jgi:molybdopterin/thiamine biosynthesis adenylyltransferase